MDLEVIGPHPFERDGSGRQRTRIGTFFPDYRALYTAPPGVHACQRIGFVEHLNARRAIRGLPPLNSDEAQRVYAESVDLFFDPDQILIRPNPEQMDLALRADEQLWELVSKRQVKFLLVSDPRVRGAIQKRGDCWRLSSIPKTSGGRQAWIFNSKVAIQYQPIYYFNRLTGTRFLTFAEFEKLGRLDPAGLARQLQEIADYAARHNRLDQPELAFFTAEARRLNASHFSGVDFERLSPDDLRARYAELKERFHAAVAHEAFRKDDCANRAWADRMIGQGSNPHHRDRPIYTTYFERDYLEGIATDKLTPKRLARPGYAARFAQLLGKAAASSIIVGRSLIVDKLPEDAPPPAPGRPPMKPVFDDGDEVVIEEAGMPVDIFPT